MSADNTSLDLLHDIVEPAAAPWWPLAPGWQVLLALAVLLLALAGLHWLARWQSRRYRREALAELGRIVAQGQGAAQLAALSRLLKRTAITAYSRPRVAGLSGAAWFAFLDATAGTRFGEGLGAALESDNYAVTRGAVAAETFAQLVAEVRRWIRCHGADIAAGEGAAASGAGIRAREAA